MVPPFISYITFNRLGLTVKNLPALLSSTEDFELHIIDNNSKDDTWDYIMSLNDCRIKSRDRFELNHGRTYALNLNLLRRLPEQYFFTVDTDVFVETRDWLSRFLNVFEAFPEAGLLGVEPKNGFLPPVITKTKANLSYLELSGVVPDIDSSYIPASCMGLRPELIKEIGYFCEENCFEDIDLSYRVCHYTNFKAGFVPDVRLQKTPLCTCADCSYIDRCKLAKVTNTCFTKYNALNKTVDFMQKNRWKFEETIRDMESGARPVYCASLLDRASAKAHIYNEDWAMDNFMYFIKNAN